MYSINVKTAEPIGPKFCVGPHMTPENGHEKKEFTNEPPTKFDCH